MRISDRALWIDKTQVMPSRISSPVSSIFFFFRDARFFGIGIDRPRQRAAHSGKMRSAIALGMLFVKHSVFLVIESVHSDNAARR